MNFVAVLPPVCYHRFKVSGKALIPIGTGEHIMASRVPKLRPRAGAATANLLLAVTAFAAVFLAAEIAVRVLYHPENLGSVIQFDPYLGWSLEPNSTLRSVDYQRDLEARSRMRSAAA